ncbi:ATP-binding protein [Candidatus Oscillochloris fontis]|uniref:ATP-binding protein n=1 Tax=Candidatus Oscillochloris fontis TaxID=2496868 RepID=UPI00101BDB48|nr:ATP-binding protein [Candidatus Oscillochloris fontis]
MTSQNLPISPPLVERTWHPTLESLFHCWQHFFFSHRNPATLDLDLLKVLTEATQADYAAFMQYDPERSMLSVSAELGVPPPTPLSPTIHVGAGVAGWVAQQCRPILFPHNPDLPASLVAEIEQHALRSVLCVPMVIGDQVHGVLYLARTAAIQHDFTCDDLWFVSLIAERQTAALLLMEDDIERRRLEAQLAQSAKIASLGVMAGGIAHEIRNPLAIIAASAQLLEDHPDDPDLRQQCVQKIVTSAQRASLIIEQLLKFSHPPQERFRPLNIHATLEDTFNLLSHQMLVSQVTLRRDFSPDVPRLYGNPELLQQVFTNLILNACNAMPQGGQLTVTTRLSGDHVELRFCDTGHGITKEHAAKIFDPFFTTRTVGKGTGLGLSISYSIIQQHQGTLEVVSEPDKGATFVIRLPVSD